MSLNDSLVTAYMTASDSLPGQLLHPEAVLGEDVGEAEPVPGQHLAMTMTMMMIMMMMMMMITSLKAVTGEYHEQLN